MDLNGQNTSSSIIKENESRVTQLSKLNIELYYSVLEEGHSYIINSPIQGYMNILFPDNSNPCISPYFFQDKSFLIRGGENIIHPINQNDVLEWKNTYGNNLAIVAFIPTEMLLDFHQKLEENFDRFENGLMTRSDSRTLLLANQIIDLNKREHLLNNLRIQSLLLEAIAHQIEGIYAENSKKEVILNKNHYDMIIRAKNIIDNDLSRNHTIPELAKEVGTNEQYLKKYFKQHFGKTVMSYITEKKMEYAKELILTGNYRVTDVARLTGYKHSTHFTTAFKKYFGFIPNSLKYTFLIAQEGAKVISELDGFIGIL